MLRIVTYNVHKCVGIDQRRSVTRIARVIEETEADVVALQEVVRRESPRHHRDDHHDQARALAELLGMELVNGPAYQERWGEYGNIVLTRLPVLGHENYDISHPRCEPRACMRVDLEVEGGPLHFYNTHFGTSLVERRAQSRRLADADILLGSHPERPQVLVGDFNDWFPSSASRLLGDHFHDLTRRIKPTYPCIIPFLRLDRIYVNAHVRGRHVHVHSSRFARVASDHAPIVASLDLDVKRQDQLASA
jgi:endonuclease/exonuclease/phosphatase family metal-dependent hydrolase